MYLLVLLRLIKVVAARSHEEISQNITNALCFSLYLDIVVLAFLTVLMMIWLNYPGILATLVKVTSAYYK